MSGITIGGFMKKIFAGMLALFCATSFVSAQSSNAAVYDDFSSPEPSTNASAPATTEANGASVNETSAATEAVSTEAVSTSTQPAATAQTAELQASAPAPETTLSTTQATASINAEPVDTASAAPVVKKKGLPKTGVGIRGGFSIGRLWGFNDLDEYIDEPSGYGFGFGAQVRVEVSDILHFTPEFTFSHLKTSHKDEDVKITYKQSYLDIGLLMRAIVFDRFFIIAGPQVSFNIGSETQIGEEEIRIPGLEGTYHNDTPQKIEQTGAEFGLNIGAGFMIFDRLSLDFRWYIGLTELFPEVKYVGDPDADIDFENDNWSYMNLAGARTMKFSFGINFWFI